MSTGIQRAANPQSLGTLASLPLLNESLLVACLLEMPNSQICLSAAFHIHELSWLMKDAITFTTRAKKRLNAYNTNHARKDDNYDAALGAFLALWL
jgi:hypothetical protein